MLLYIPPGEDAKEVCKRFCQGDEDCKKSRCLVGFPPPKSDYEEKLEAGVQNPESEFVEPKFGEFYP